MALDKAALESLRLERDPDAGKYRERGGSRRWLWYVARPWSPSSASCWPGARSTVPCRCRPSPSKRRRRRTGRSSTHRVTSSRAGWRPSVPKVTGRVTEVLFEEGAEVEAGQVLARLDRRHGRGRNTTCRPAAPRRRVATCAKSRCGSPMRAAHARAQSLAGRDASWSRRACSTAPQAEVGCAGARVLRPRRPRSTWRMRRSGSASRGSTTWRSARRSRAS